MKTAITIEFDDDALTGYTDEHLALLWHVAQANPAPITQSRAGEVAERIGREIIRRFLRTVDPALWNHQGRHYYQCQLSDIAKYTPGGPSGTPDWYEGTWAPKEIAEPAGGAS